jgi:hypothetical protein
MPTLLIVRVGLGHGSDSHLADTATTTKMSSLQFSSIFPQTTVTAISHSGDVPSETHSLPAGANDSDV